ncbi:hypothetical protein GJAV_G00272650 [Gymnothorax javanicus]|nr:hypothetical protein GJAV_G00272650 [Gymnothorax javanicus]
MGDNSCGNNTQQLDRTVNSWCIDYYTFAGINAFRSGDHKDFCTIRDILQSLVARPLKDTEVFRRQVRVMQFLSRINDGDKQSVNFDFDDGCTPLESALTVLTSISQEFLVPKPVFERIQESIYEAEVIICLKKNNYLKAKEIVTKHLPSSLASKKENLLQLVNSKTSEPLLLKAAMRITGQPLRNENGPGNSQPTSDTRPAQPHSGLAPQAPVQIRHSQLQAAYDLLREEHQGSAPFTQLEYQVRQEVPWENALWDAEGPGARRGPCTIPQLLLEEDSLPSSLCLSQDDPAATRTDDPAATRTDDSAATRTGDPAATRTDDPAATQTDDPASTRTDDPAATRTDKPAAVPQGNAAPGEERSGSASPVLPCITRRAARARRNDTPVRPPNEPETPPRRPPQNAASEKTTPRSESPLSSISTPVLPYRRQRTRPPGGHRVQSSDEGDESDSSCTSCPAAGTSRTSALPEKTSENGPARPKRRLLDSTVEAQDVWSDEDSLFPKKPQRTKGTGAPKRTQEARRRWTAEESEWVRRGVAQYGEGNWAKIRDRYPFKGRTAVNIKDRWRNMKKLM